MRMRFTLWAVLAGFASLALGAEGVAPAGRMAWVVGTDSHGRLTRRLIPVAAPAAVSASAPRKEKIVPIEVKEIVELAADKYAIDPLLVHSVISVESNYNPMAQSPKGAQGLMQLIPETAKRFGAQNSFDSKENIEAGIRYLKHLQGLYKDDLTLTLAAYNAGEGAVAKYKNAIPPYHETIDYVKKVGNRYEEAKRRKAAVPPPAAPAAAAVASAGPPVEEFRHLEQVRDDQGRVYLRTR